MTTDWAKLKVVDLKAELKRRGLANVGRKDELVQRLRDADEEATVDADAEVDAEKPEPSPAPEDPTAGESPADQPAEPVVQSPKEPEPVAAHDHPIDAPGRTPPKANDATTEENGPTKTETTRPVLTSHSETEGNGSLPSLAPAELIQDAQKRKRRSKSPSPSPAAASKRARLSDGAAVEKHDVVKSDARATSRSENLEPEIPGMSTEDEQVDYGGDTPPHATDRAATPQAHHGPAREAFLPGAPSGAVSAAKPEQEDDVMTGYDNVEPSIHPPTPALYIKNFMRPLRTAEVEEHLKDLATSNGRHGRDDVVVDFYLDQIRTHAFVEFRSTSIAVEVRAALHNKVWPDERNRKALWVDFLPADKVRAFVDQEELAETGRRNSSNRFDLVYSRVGDRVEVSLENTNADSTRPAQASSRPVVAPPASNAAPAAYADVPSGPSRPPPGLEGAPSGPKGFVHPSRQGLIPKLGRQEPPTVPSQAPNPSRGPAFGRAPDGRPDGRAGPGGLPGRVTRAGPPLAYGAVPEELAHRRLDNLQTYIAKNPPRDMGRESNRYTFQDASFVDRGREIFEGIRPPHREKQKQERERREREERERGQDRRTGVPASYRDSDRDRYGGRGGGGGGRSERDGQHYRDDDADKYGARENRDNRNDNRNDSRNDSRNDYRSDYRDDYRDDYRGNYRGDNRDNRRGGYRGGFRDDYRDSYDQAAQRRPRGGRSERDRQNYGGRW